MATATYSRSNVYEFTVDKNQMKSFKKRLETPGLTKEYLEECKQIAEMYRKPKR